jgi:hypothetical protein
MNTSFIKKVAVVAAIGSLIAAASAVKKVRAVTSVIQPFTAVELNTNIAGKNHGAFGPASRDQQLPVASTYTRIFAVRSDGSVTIAQELPHTARVTKSIWTRMIFNETNKTATFYDPLTMSAVSHKFYRDQTLTGGPICTGTPAGQIEGFDVVTTHKPTQYKPDGEIINKQNWFAPKLGCFALKEERISMHEGSMMFTSTRQMSNIKIGEPDPWFFDEADTVTGMTSRTQDEWVSMYKQVM